MNNTELFLLTCIITIWLVLVFFMLFTVATSMLGDWAGYLILLVAIITISSFIRLALEIRE